MVRKFFISFICSFVFAISAFSQYQSEKGKIKIIITNLKNQRGEVLISLHNKEKGFPGDTTFSLLSRAHKITADSVEYEFMKIPFGEYAVAIFHDENGNYQLDTNMFGIPSEGIGVSNDAYRLMGPPKYEEAKFDLNKSEKIIHITMHYY